MKIVINNVQFPYDIACKVLKLKGGECPFEELSDIWDNIVPLSFSEIAQLENLEQRRIAIANFGMDKLISEVKPKLISKDSIDKKTTWINKEGVLEDISFTDTYELYEVSGEKLFGGVDNNSFSRRLNNFYYVKCKDTSTDREYLIWVDIDSVKRTNLSIDLPRWNTGIEDINAIQCVAWTITTNVPLGSIKQIVRQGDCIMIKPKKNTEFLISSRHLTEKEYRKYLILES